MLGDWRFWVVALVAAQRLAEVGWSAHRARQEGGSGTARRLTEPAYRWMVVVHGGWLAGCLAELLVWPLAVSAPWMGAMGVVWAGAIALRWWVLASLGRLWSVHLLERPQQPVIVAGPYAFVRHPNYLAVILEIAAVPLLIGAWRTALVGSVCNAVVLTFRIAKEEKYLFTIAGYASAFSKKKRLIPWVI